MQDIVVGQRWVSSAELNMGLGTVIAVEHRTVTLSFPATGETRTYAKQGAPLSRVHFAPGDSILSADNRGLKIDSVEENDGLLNYIGVDEDGNHCRLPEGELSHFMQLNRPGERLFSGQVDANRLFDLRQAAWQHLNRLASTDLYGLTGCRTSLIPHQLFIAHEIGRRYAPRVLLADEVGLGKTIEAGLILHQQLLNERAGRVLIVVPESLVHQWLVEMLRRFNLFFSVFDEARCEAAGDDAPGDNPFHSQQLVLVSLEFLAGNETRFQQALAGEWDLLVVDEAHHLAWSPQQASHEYRLVEQLAAVTQGVLLLTATPEQLGRASHFARLRLLDPDRFPDLDAFIAEEDGYAPVARAVDSLLNDAPLDNDSLQILTQSLHDEQATEQLQRLQDASSDASVRHSARETLVAQLLDRHGTGRVLFRNTRNTVKGFPQRQAHASALPLPEAYAQLPAAAGAGLLCPERVYSDTPHTLHWTRIDPRFDWLSELLTGLKPNKVLVIAAHAATAIELADALYQRAGLHAAVFHEGLSLLERDRSAAFFADNDAGTQVLICSEIGSEGRNFQFAHHLVLFDLPLNPDLLEQRIGRLDRIGQTQTIQIHIPYIEDSAQEVMYRWYQHGLAAFEQTSPACQQIYEQLQQQLLDRLGQPPGAADELLAQAAAMNTALNQALQQGRDRLLEYNSCRQPQADRLCERANQLEDAGKLSSFMDDLFDAYGVHSRLHSEGCLIIRPGEHMLHPVPGLPDDGITITYDRNIALTFEDAHYLSWEHPIVRDCMDMLLSSELGNCAVSAVKYAAARPGTLLLECLFILESGHQALRAGHHLPPTMIRVVIDENGMHHADALSAEHISTNCVSVNPDTARQIVLAREQVLRDLLKTSAAHADHLMPEQLAAARRQGRNILQKEIERLRALAKLNPNVRAAEIHFFEHQLQLFDSVLDATSPRLDALRVLVST